MFREHLQKTYNWFSIEQLTNLIAVSNITPGPIGVNMATYAGYTTAGIFGSLLATTAIMTGPFFIILIISKFLRKYKSCPVLNNFFYGLRPAACALLTSIAINLAIDNIVIETTKIDTKSFLLFIFLLLIFSFQKKNPILIIFLGAFSGVIFNINF